MNVQFSALALAGAMAVVGCGGEVTDVGQSVEQINTKLLAPHAQLDCPKEVDGGDGKSFECTLKARTGSGSAPVTMKITRENGELAVDLADPKRFDAALKKVTGS